MPNPNVSRPIAWALTAIATVLSLLLRITALLPNVNPVGALGLYAGGRLRWWLAWAPPVAVMALADLYLYVARGVPGFDSWVYGSVLIYVLVGRLLIGSKSPWRVGAAATLGSLQFFLITNFGVWYSAHGLAHELYPFTLAGLIQCYIMGLPFLGYTLLGDLGCSAAVFGAEAWVTRSQTAATPAAEEVRA